MLNGNQAVVGLLRKLKHLLACPQAKSHIRLIQSRIRVYTQMKLMSTVSDRPFSCNLFIFSMLVRNINFLLQPAIRSKHFGAVFWLAQNMWPAIPGHKLTPSFHKLETGSGRIGA